MIFKKYTVYENKLSEQISDNNPLKQKLIDMETPTDKHPVYSFLSIGLLLYVWMFLIALVYNRAYGYQLAIAVVLFTTSCFAIVYKKPYLTSHEHKYERNIYIIAFITTLFSIIISVTDSGNLPLRDLGKVFLFFMEINSKSYIAISVLAFLSLGISSAYHKCSYEIYRGLYSNWKTYNLKISLDKNANKYFNLSILAILSFVPLLYIIFNPTTDSFQIWLKGLSMLCFLFMPALIITGIEIRRYLEEYQFAKDNINENNKQGE